ncbi:AEC family transporter [Halocynthiibacter styelae]|uniref:AEC family transporter n=1 Tax=Halocynthiibacter styelae TaxID=2761955 RepID=A0A8J7LQD2_9RHOB|nr:AEC family transporter [Paenihalocynthiibacter styelae]MBI1494192.1 AEC family transporter [Paenihalocynthiibacter styelae]
MDLALLVLPVFLTILCGYGLAVSGGLPADQWTGVEVMSFRLLIPAVLIGAIAESDLEMSRFGPLIAMLVLTLVILGVLMFLLRLILPQSRMDDASFTTLFQSATRWNGFIGLALAEQIAGQEGILLIAVVMAFLIPLINIVNIIMLSVYGPGQFSLKVMMKTIVTNPLVQACAIGLTLSVSGLSIPGPIAQSLDFIGRAALGVGLLAVGAGITFRRLLRVGPLVVLGLILRPLLAPAIFILLGSWVGLVPLQLLIGAMVMAVPAAANGYIIARRMGGNAGLYADIMTWQAIAGMLVLPGLLYLLPL